MLSGPLARASGQVSDRFTGICDKFTTFWVEKPVSDRIALSRHVVIVLAGTRQGQVRCVFDVLARWTLKNDQTYDLFDTSLVHFFDTLI